MTSRFEGKVVLVTGAAGAIGRATATRLAKEGATLVLADLRSDSLHEFANALEADGARSPFVVEYDAASSDSSGALVDQTLSMAGRLDVVCNIAGTYAKAHSKDMPIEDWNRVLQINLSSVFSISQKAIPALAESGGCMINTTSLAALEGHPYLTAYAVAKAGIITLTKSLAAEYASTGIRFNAVCPGGIRSPMSAMPAVPGTDPDLAFRRPKLKGFEDGVGEPEDIAAAFAYLGSSDARFVSGTVLVVDGAQFLM